MENNIKHNDGVKTAYFKILKYGKVLLTQVPEKPLRQTLERPLTVNHNALEIIHEFISPLIYLRLECYSDMLFCIHYGYEQNELYTKYYPITSAFIRSIYRFTAKENTEINIEGCVHTDWVITNCAELFEYIGDRNKYHTFRTIDYIPSIETQFAIKTAQLS